MPIAENGTAYVDNTTLAAVQACKTKAALRHVLDLVAGNEESACLDAGSAAHDALAMYFQGQQAEDCLRYFDLTYKPLVEDAGFEDPKHRFHRLSWPNLHNILEQWFEDHLMGSFPFSVDPELVEVGFEMPLSNGCVCGHTQDVHTNKNGCRYRAVCKCEGYRPAFVFWGRADAVVQSRHDDALYVLDHKTTGRIGSYWAEKFRLDSQLSGYTWAIRETLGMPIAGAYINAIEFSTLPSDSSRKCRLHDVKFEECGSFHMKSSLLIYDRSEYQLKTWQGMALSLALQYRELGETVKKVEDIHQVPMDGVFNNACGFCSFSDFCRAGRPEHYQDTMLKYSPWRPY